MGGPQLVPYSKNKGLQRPKLKGRSHYHSYVDACLGKDSTTSIFGFAVPLTETTLLGNIANRFNGKKLDWDQEKMTITNNDEANSLVKKTPRDFS